MAQAARHQLVHIPFRWAPLSETSPALAVEGSHPNFRCFLSADPSNGIPIGLLERSIKLTNEPPQGKDHFSIFFP